MFPEAEPADGPRGRGDRAATTRPLLPAGMSRLSPPWSDLTRRRTRGLAELPHTRASEQSALDALTAAQPAPRPPARSLWNDDSWELFERIRQGAGERLDEALPDAGSFTREGVAAVVEDWAGSARPPVPRWWLRRERDLIVETLARDALSDWARDVLRWLGEQPYDAAAIAAAAGRCAVGGLAPGQALELLHALGSPEGERALLDVVREGETDEDAHALTRERETDAGTHALAREAETDEDVRARAREALIELRRPRYEARARRPARDEAPLLPPAVRELPYSWGSGFQWPEDLPEDEENTARARAVLTALAPAEPLPGPFGPAPDPAGSGTGDDRLPAWLDVRAVMWELMPYPRQVTRERMAEAVRECALLGVPGVPRDPDGAEARRFARQWATWIGAWIAAGVFVWLGRDVDDDALLTPWAMELAERYARCGTAAQEAVDMLRWHGTAARSREALTRLATDPTLPPHLRDRAATP
ncbi:hypothetical protein [Streptomyces sp. NPDC046985]|uniref:hypothetical protein n=1 Tax=Streptomyces sp. NPDC046985 TaxID=3155377 RepID=UPI0033EFB299